MSAPFPVPGQTPTVSTVVSDLEQRIAEIERERDSLKQQLERLEDSAAVRLQRRLASIFPLESLQGIPARGVREVPQHHRLASLPPPARHPDDFAPASALTWAGVARSAHPAGIETFVRDQPRVVAICHPEWRGIRAATLGQCAHVLEVPGLQSQRHAQRLVDFLEDCGTTRVAINGYPPGTRHLVEQMCRRSGRFRVFLIHHGTPAQSHVREDLVLQQLTSLAAEHPEVKLGFVKQGLAEIFAKQGLSAEHVMNVVDVPACPPTAPDPSGLVHVGVFAEPICHKNVETQILAALSLPATLVHAVATPPMAYLPATDRLHIHGLQPRTEFLRTLRSCHAALYVSLVECYPMTVLEALMCGVVCLTSHTSALFDDDPELFDQLVVTAHDNPTAIANKLASALANREELVPRAQRHVEALNERARRRLREFFEE